MYQFDIRRYFTFSGIDYMINGARTFYRLGRNQLADKLQIPVTALKANEPDYPNLPIREKLQAYFRIHPVDDVLVINDVEKSLNAIFLASYNLDYQHAKELLDQLITNHLIHHRRSWIGIIIDLATFFVNDSFQGEIRDIALFNATPVSLERLKSFAESMLPDHLFIFDCLMAYRYAKMQCLEQVNFHLERARKNVSLELDSFFRSWLSLIYFQCGQLNLSFSHLINLKYRHNHSTTRKKWIDLMIARHFLKCGDIFEASSVLEDEYPLSLLELFLYIKGYLAYFNQDYQTMKSCFCHPQIAKQGEALVLKFLAMQKLGENGDVRILREVQYWSGYFLTYIFFQSLSSQHVFCDINFLHHRLLRIFTKHPSSLLIEVIKKERDEYLKHKKIKEQPKKKQTI